MKALMGAIFALLLFFGGYARAVDDISDPGEVLSPGATDTEIADVISSDAVKDFLSPERLSFSDDDLQATAALAKKVHESLEPATGGAGEAFDVIVQIGHYKRVKGVTGGQGVYVTEQEYAAYVGDMLVEDLAANDVKVILIGADDYDRPLNARIFIALHTDSAELPCQVGPSVGYDSTSDSNGMHLIAYGLALSLGITDIKKFMKDSYTKGLRHYYAFRDIEVEDFEGVLEMSELSCPDQEAVLLENASYLAKNLSLGIQWALRPANP